MAGKDIIIMSTKELKRLPVIRNVIDKQITQIEAANILGLCEAALSNPTNSVAAEKKRGSE